MYKRQGIYDLKNQRFLFRRTIQYDIVRKIADCLDETMKIVISNYKRTEIPETFLPYEAWIAEKIG